MSEDSKAIWVAFGLVAVIAAGFGAPQVITALRGIQIDWPAWIQAASAVATVGLTVGLLIVAIMTRAVAATQARISETQARLAEELEKPVLIPRAGLGLVGYKGASVKSAFPSVEVCFQNIGRGPAIVDCWHAGVIVSSKEPERSWGRPGFCSSFTTGDARDETKDGVVTRYTGTNLVFYMKIIPSDQTVMPGDHLGWQDLKGVELNSAQIANIASGEQTVWIDGVIFYSETSGKKRESHFRWQYATELDMMIRGGAPEWNRYT